MRTNRISFRISCFLGLFFLSSWCFCQSLGPFPLPIHAGRIERLERVATPVDFVQLEAALAQGESSPPDLVPDVLRTQVSPPTGEVYLVFTVAIQADRSLSTLDYRLQAQGREFTCKGMALESNNAYDLRRVVQKGPAVVKLLFTCPEKAEEAVLASAFLQIPLTRIPKIVLLEPPEEESKEAEAESEDESEGDADKQKEKDQEDDKDKKTEPDKKAPAKPATKKAPAKKKPAAESSKDGDKPAAKEEAKPAPKPAAKPAEDLWF